MRIYQMGEGRPYGAALSGVDVVLGQTIQQTMPVQVFGGTGQYNVVSIDYAALANSIDSLKNSIDDLKQEISALKDRLELALSPPIVRTISDDEAKKEIKKYFDSLHGETLYPSDVADDLNLDYDIVVRLIQELVDDGQIAAT